LFALDNVAIADATVFELLVLLERDGWAWQRWVSQGKRSKKKPDLIPLSYRPGEAKFFFTTLHASRSYLQILADVAELRVK
jgi:hypothetical protein